MANITDTRTSLDNTVKIFDSFYATTMTIPADRFDIVRAYFRSVCSTTNIADNFTALFFRISNESGIDSLELLKDIKGTPNKLQLNTKLAYYMNSFKSKTSLYGISTVPQPLTSITRNIVI